MNEFHIGVIFGNTGFYIAKSWGGFILKLEYCTQNKQSTVG